MTGDEDGAANGGPLTMPSLGPADTDVAAQALRVTRLPIVTMLQAQALCTGWCRPLSNNPQGSPRDSGDDDHVEDKREGEKSTEEDNTFKLIPMLLRFALSSATGQLPLLARPAFHSRRRTHGGRSTTIKATSSCSRPPAIRSAPTVPWTG